MVELLNVWAVCVGDDSDIDRHSDLLAYCVQSNATDVCSDDDDVAVAAADDDDD